MFKDLFILEWLIGWLINWLIDWLMDWLIDWSIDWLINWLVFQVDLYYGPNFELLGAKKDFKMNSQFSTATGMLGEVSS